MKHLQRLIEKYAVILLLVIVLIGGFFRFYQLSTLPPAMNWDEVAFGYNAYSLLTTGKDEYGTAFPLYLRSLDDYKRPVYSYATVASVALFGLNDFAVRFPAAFFGTLTILLIYLITYELFKKKSLALLAAFFLAITPWHIQFSHAAFEASIGFFLTGLGVLCSLWGIRRNFWWLSGAAIAFGLAMYSYLGQRVAVPILIVTLVFLYYPKILAAVKSKQKKALLPLGVAFLILTLFFLSIGRDSLHPEGNIRYKATSIFTHSSDYETAFHRMQVDGSKNINLTRRAFHDNQKFTSFELVVRGYLTHFSPDFFFFDLGQQHHHAPGVGLLYIWMLPFLVIGVYGVIRHEKKSVSLLLGAWALGPAAGAAVTFQIPHALRVGDMIIPLIIIIAYGCALFFSWLTSYRKILVLPVLLGFLAVGTVYLIYFFHQYTVHLPEERSKDWVYGRREAVAFAETHKEKYDKIIVSNNLEYPYIFFLYYTKYDPKTYQSEGGTRSGGFAEEKNAFSTYEFHNFDFTKDSVRGNILFIGTPDDFPPGVQPVKKINYLNGVPAIYIVEGKSEK